MKKSIILMVAFAIISLPAFCQKNVPEIVKKEFAKRYPAAQTIKWSSEETNEWEAEFKINGTEMSASYDNKGTWLESEAEITIKDLPAAVTNTLTKEFPGYKTGEMSAIENPQMKGFELALKKGGISLEVVFDNMGKVLKKTEVKKEK
jgi:hypothetical protein